MIFVLALLGVLCTPLGGVEIGLSALAMSWTALPVSRFELVLAAALMWVAAYPVVVGGAIVGGLIVAGFSGHQRRTG